MFIKVFLIFVLFIYNYLGLCQMRTVKDYQKIHKDAIVVDMHNDLLSKSKNYDWSIKNKSNHTDIPRLIKGGIDVQFLAIWVSPRVKKPYERGLEYAKLFYRRCEENENKVGIAKKYDDVINLNKNGKIALILCVEGGNVIEGDVKKLIEFYNLGARYLTITWNKSYDWAYSSKDKNSKKEGLSSKGKKIIQTMDSLGMIIDISHTGSKTIDDILKITKNPIIASHSGSYTLRPHYRNLTDDQIKAIAKTGGVIGVNFCGPFLVESGAATVKDVVNHIDYIVKLVGVDYVGLGSDFDGILTTPKGLEDVSKYPAITKELLNRGYSETDIKKILGGNVLRVFKTVCK